MNALGSIYRYLYNSRQIAHPKNVILSPVLYKSQPSNPEQLLSLSLIWWRIDTGDQGPGTTRDNDHHEEIVTGDHKICVLSILMTDNLSPYDKIIACNYENYDSKIYSVVFIHRRIFSLTK